MTLGFWGNWQIHVHSLLSIVPGAVSPKLERRIESEVWIEFKVSTQGCMVAE